MKTRPGQLSDVLRAALAADVKLHPRVALEAAALANYERGFTRRDVVEGAERVASEMGLRYEVSRDGRKVYFTRSQK